MKTFLDYSERAAYIKAVFEKMYHEGDLTQLSLSEISDIHNFGPDGRCKCSAEMLVKQCDTSKRLLDLALKVDEEQFEQGVLNNLAEEGVVAHNKPNEI